MKDHRGFSLLELLIVVAIILIIATVAIPSLLRSRQAANESSAVANLRSLNTAEVSYSSSTGFYGSRAALIADGLIDSRFNGMTSGYNYSVDLAPGGLGYTAYATAASDNMGRWDYYTTPDFVIRYTTIASRAPAGLAGEPVR